MSMAEHLGDRILHLILPLFIVIIGHLWYYAYMIRNKLLEDDDSLYDDRHYRHFLQHHRRYHQ